MDNQTTFIAMLLLLVLMAIAASETARADQSYNYIEIKAGQFFNGCETCQVPDGSYPAYIMAGRNFYINRNVNIKAEFVHRSNYDIGWPNKGETGANEYSRDGFFASLVLKF